MDRNQATGLILIALMVITYFTFFAPEPPPPAPEPEVAEQTSEPAPSEPAVYDSSYLQVKDSILIEPFFFTVLMS